MWPRGALVGGQLPGRRRPRIRRKRPAAGL